MIFTTLLILSYTIFYVQRLEIIFFDNLSKHLKNKLQIIIIIIILSMNIFIDNVLLARHLIS